MTLQVDEEQSLNFEPVPGMAFVPAVGNSYGFMSHPEEWGVLRAKHFHSPEQYTDHPPRDVPLSPAKRNKKLSNQMFRFQNFSHFPPRCGPYKYFLRENMAPTLKNKPMAYKLLTLCSIKAILFLPIVKTPGILFCNLCHYSMLRLFKVMFKKFLRAVLFMCTGSKISVKI